jgi:hypothetical protein
VEQVLGVNRVLLEALEKDRSVGNVASAFTKMAEYLKVYSVYCSNQDTALKLVEDAEKRVPAFKKWITANQQKFLSRGLDLRDFLIKPTQRICKYPLFLRELIENTAPDADTHRELLEVNTKISAVVLHINEQRRLKVGLEGVLEVYQRLSNADYPLIKSQRVLVFKGQGPLQEVVVPIAVPHPLGGSSNNLSVPGSPRVKGDDKNRSLLGSFKRSSTSRRGSKPDLLSSPTLSAPSSSGLRTSASVIEPGEFLRETFLFIFNDLFLFCRPCKTIGKKDRLDIFLEVPPDRVRARAGSLAESIEVRLLRDCGPEDKPTRFLFQCKDGLEQSAWLEALGKLNPFAPLSFRSREPYGVCMAAELESMGGRLPVAEQQLMLLSQRLKASQMKKQKMDTSDEATEEVLRKMMVLWYSMPQWKFQARELKRLYESMLGWLAALEPHSKHSRKAAYRTESGEVGLVSLRKHQQKLKEERSVRDEEGTPPPLPARCDEDYEEVEEMQEEYEDGELDLDKLSEALRSLPQGEGKNPSDVASPGPAARKKKTRWVKRKVRRKRTDESEGRRSSSTNAAGVGEVTPPPPSFLPAIGEIPETLKRVVNMDPRPSGQSRSVPSSPSSSRKGPGKKAPPPSPPARQAAPAEPDFPYEDLSEQVKDFHKKMGELARGSQELYESYKQLKKDLVLKIGALSQLVEALKT